MLDKLGDANKGELTIKKMLEGVDYQGKGGKFEKVYHLVDSNGDGKLAAGGRVHTGESMRWLAAEGGVVGVATRAFWGWRMQRGAQAC